MRPADPCKNGHAVRKLRCMSCMRYFCPLCQPKFKKRCAECVVRVERNRKRRAG